MEQKHFQLHFEIEEKHWWFQGRRTIIRELIREIIPPSRETILLEVGCGTGGNLLHLIPYYHVIGCDISEQAINFAKQKLAGIDLIVGCAPDDVQEWMQRAQILLLLDVLEHVEYDEALLNSLLINMRKGAVLMLTVPADKRLWSPHDEVFGHLRRYELKDLKNLVKSSLGDCLLLSFFSSRLYPLIRIVRQVNALRGKSSGKGGTDFWMSTPVINTMLWRIFSGEAGTLKECFYTPKSAYPFGSSLIGVFKKK
jgi:SAM-dependent methyltransferase